MNEKERNQLLVDAVTQMLEYIQQERQDNPELPGIKQITILPNPSYFSAESWVVWAIMDNGKAYKYAWYVDENGIVADGF